MAFFVVRFMFMSNMADLLNILCDALNLDLYFLVGFGDYYQKLLFVSPEKPFSMFYETWNQITLNVKSG